MLKRRIYSYFGSLVLVGIGLVLIFLLKRYQKDLQKEVLGTQVLTSSGSLSFASTKLQAISLLVSVCIILMNFLLGIAMKYFCKIEKHESKTSFDLSFVQKLLRIQLINSLSLVVMSHIFLAEDNLVIWLQGGLLYDAFFLMLSKVVMFVIDPFLEFMQFVKVLKRGKFKDNPKGSTLLQYEANKLFTGVKIDLPDAYSGAISIFYICIFFMPLLPFSGIFLFVGIVILYFQQKIRFARIYKRPAEIESRIAIDAIYRLGFGSVLLFVSHSNSVDLSCRFL